MNHDTNEPAKGKYPVTKIKRHTGLYRYERTGEYHARVRVGGKSHRCKLGTDFELAKRRLADFRRDLERIDASKGNTSFAEVLDEYSATRTGSHSTLGLSNRGVEKLKQTFPGSATQPLRDIKPSQFERWLAQYCGSKSESYYNGMLTLIRSALDMAVRDRIIADNPIAGLKYRKRKKPIRLTPSFEQFEAIVADIRSQKLNGHDAEVSGDFVEFLGLAGLGQAEASSITRADVDLAAGRIAVYRHKTDMGFWIPIYPQVRPLVEKLCVGKKPNEHLFPIDQARKGIAAACHRLGFTRFTHRSLRRMFITRAIELGVDVKVIAQWQGHKDGGKLILDTYSHVRPEHSNRMALLMTRERPQNVVPMAIQEAR